MIYFLENLINKNCTFQSRGEAEYLFTQRQTHVSSLLRNNISHERRLKSPLLQLH